MMTETNVEQTAEADANAVAQRYLAASLATRTREPLEFDFGDLQPVLDFVNDKFDGQGAILHVYNDIMREFSKGHRCRVCGRTEKQNAALDYDCALEC